MLGQMCGTEVWMPRQQEDSYYRMALLAQFVVTTPSHLRRRRDREQLRLTSCPTCGNVCKISLRRSHTDTCSYPLLCLPTRSQHTARIRHYLQRQWAQTKTDVALEIGHHPSHVLMAYMRHYPDGKYQHAGALVEALIELEETKAPTWDVTEMIERFVLSRPLSTTQAALPKQTVASMTTPLLQPFSRCRTSAPSTTISTPQGATAVLRPQDTEPRKQKLLNEAFDLYLPLRCKACNKTEANALIIDCGHVFICDSCAKTQDKCPICLGRITEVVRVYRM